MNPVIESDSQYFRRLQRNALERARTILDENPGTLTQAVRERIEKERNLARALGEEAEAAEAKEAARGRRCPPIPIDYEAQWGGGGEAGAGTGPEVWRDSTGRSVRVLGKQHRVADTVSDHWRREHGELSIGRLVRGWLTGKWEGGGAELRALKENINSSGGILVPDALSARLIDAARDRSVMIGMGVRTIAMESDHCTIARVATDPTYSMKAEGVALDESDPVFDGVTLTAKKLGTIVRVSRELLEDAANAEAMLEGVLVRSFAAELDRQGLWGSGSAEILGVYNYSGIGSQTNVGTPAGYAKWIGAWSTILANGGQPNAYTVSPRDAGTLEGLLSAVNGVYLAPPANIGAMRRVITPSTPITGLPGSNESASLMAQWDTIAWGIRRDVRLEASTDRYFDTDEVGFKLTWRGDLVIEQPTWVQRITGITAS